MSDDTGTPRTTPPLVGPLEVSREAVRRVHLWPIGWALAAGVTTSVTLLVTVWFGVSWLLGSPHRAPAKPLDTAGQLDLLRLTFAVVAGVGGIIALVTAYRRQRIAETANQLAERAQVHAEWVAQGNAHDASERRVTDLYGQAVEQLGHATAAVRLGGLYSLERLAQDRHRHRPTVADVVCAYLRMPFQLPANTRTGAQYPPVGGGDTSASHS